MAVGSVETSWTLLPDTGPSPVRFLELKEMVSSWRGPGTLVLVTHAPTVCPLTGFLPAQAETVVLQPASANPRGGSLVGRIAPPGKPKISSTPSSSSERTIACEPVITVGGTTLFGPRTGEAANLGFPGARRGWTRKGGRV